MPTTRSFNSMLNEYLPYRLLQSELLKRSWLLANVEKDTSWNGEGLIVPFRGSAPTSSSFGSLTAANNVAESTFVRGEVSTYSELYHTIVLNQRDLADHSGPVPESTFLKVVPDETEAGMDQMKIALNSALVNGAAFALATGDGGADGTITVNKVDQFEIDQEVYLDDDNSSPLQLFVIAIDVNAADITLSASRGGSAADISAYTLAQNAKFYRAGAQTAANQFASLRDQLLSAANGGAANIFGVTKTDYPFTQSVNVDGSGISASSLLDDLFDAGSEIQQKARGGKITTYLMSLKHLGNIMKAVQVEKGGFHVRPEQTKVSEFGWTEIVIGSPNGNVIKCVGSQELFDDVIFALDMKAMKFHTKGMIKRHKDPNGNEFYTVRNTTGYQYFIDLVCYGELVVSKPSNCGVIHSISY